VRGAGCSDAADKQWPERFSSRAVKSLCTASSFSSVLHVLRMLLLWRLLSLAPQHQRPRRWEARTTLLAMVQRRLRRNRPGNRQLLRQQHHMPLPRYLFCRRDGSGKGRAGSSNGGATPPKIKKPQHPELVSVGELAKRPGLDGAAATLRVLDDVKERLVTQYRISARF